MTLYEKIDGEWVAYPLNIAERVTKVDPKFTHAFVGKTGTVIHAVMAAYVRWDEPPFPIVTYALACSGKQWSVITPVLKPEVVITCSRCRKHLGMKHIEYPWRRT